MNFRLKHWVKAIAVTGLLSIAAQAATIPAGVQLHASQTLIRNNGSEPETLDPALAESVGANNIMRDLFEGLTATNEACKECLSGTWCTHHHDTLWNLRTDIEELFWILEEVYNFLKFLFRFFCTI